MDLIRESVRLVMQDLIEPEAAQTIGADQCVGTESRTTERNGSRPRLASTQTGDIDLNIPKLRQGSFFPVILERRGRIDQALCAVVMEAWVNVVSTIWSRPWGSGPGSPSRRCLSGQAISVGPTMYTKGQRLVDVTLDHVSADLAYERHMTS